MEHFTTSSHGHFELHLKEIDVGIGTGFFSKFNLPLSSNLMRNGVNAKIRTQVDATLSIQMLVVKNCIKYDNNELIRRQK